MMMISSSSFIIIIIIIILFFIILLLLLLLLFIVAACRVIINLMPKPALLLGLPAVAFLGTRTRSRKAPQALDRRGRNIYLADPR